MLDVIELNTLFEKLGTPEAGRKLVRQAQSKAPVRQVQSRGNNVHVLFNSQKMGCVQECESHRVEFPFVVMLENDPTVLEYYLQPCELHVPVQDADGRLITRIRHIPDALVMRQDGIWLEEYKQEARLLSLVAKQPHRYARDDAGNWRSYNIEAHLADRGLGYRIRSDAEIPHRFVENLLFLRDYYDPDLPPLGKDKVASLTSLLAACPCIYVAEAIDAGMSLTADDIFQAVAAGAIVADLDNESLSDPKRARLFRDSATLEFLSRVADSPADTLLRERLDVSLNAGTRIQFDGVEYQITLAGAESVALTTTGESPKLVPRSTLETLYKEGRLVVDSDGQAERLVFPVADLSRVHPLQLEDAIHRQDILNGTLGKEHGYSDRTLREWRHLIAVAVEGAIAPIAALVPKTHLRGNRTRRVPEETLDLIQKVALKAYFSPEQKKLKHCYTLFMNQCREAGLTAVSEVTFRAEVKRMKNERTLLARFGKRIVYKDSPHFVHLGYRVPVHGVRPWEVCHIDHTELDIELICAKTGKNLGRPWLTLAIDACTRRIVGFSLSFDPPSYRSCMMVIRDIVRRYGRLPSTFVLDNGKEFKSRDFKLLAKIYGCDIRYRPSAKSRFGSVMERLFGVANTQFVHNLAGNTQVTKHVRSMVKSVNPKNLAEWPLEWFYFAFEYWAIELYDQLEHPALDMTPRHAYEQGMKNTGARSHKLVRFDRTFLIMTCPSVEGDTRSVSKARGVKMLNDYYWSDVFRRSSTWSRDVEAKIDPWDIRVAYVWLDGRWERCVSKHYGQLGQMSLTELRAYTEETRRKYALHSKALSAAQVVEWTKAQDPNNFKDTLRLRQDAMRNLQAGLGMGAIEPEPADLPTSAFALPATPLASASIPPTAPYLSEDDNDYELF